MKKPWYRQLFSRTEGFSFEATALKADAGDANAQFALGLSYGLATGTSQNLLCAALWYRKAADQNHSLAQFNLGIMYAEGQGVARDDAQALVWIRKAAELGDAGAQFNLGTRHYTASLENRETDPSESKIEACKWFHLASAQGYGESDAACDLLTMSMTREEVAEGNHRAAMFTSARPNTEAIKS